MGHDQPACGHTHDHSHSHDGDAHGDSHEGEHTHPHGHVHTHHPKEKKRQMNRISRMIGHLEHVKRMIEADEDCADVLIQLSAVRSAMNGLGKEIISEHLKHCVSQAIEENDIELVEDFEKALKMYL